MCNNYKMHPYHNLTLYIDRANGTLEILHDQEAYTYLYNKIAMDIYMKQQSTVSKTSAIIEENVKWLLSLFIFWMFCRMVIYIIKRLVTPIRIIVNDYR